METDMKKLALGIVAAATIFTAVPAMAQVGFYAGPRGAGVEFGAPGYSYAPYGGYYDYYGGPVGGPALGWHEHGWHGHGRFEGHHRHWH
jgi:hypothetical protein